MKLVLLLELPLRPPLLPGLPLLLPGRPLPGRMGRPETETALEKEVRREEGEEMMLSRSLMFEGDCARGDE